MCCKTLQKIAVIYGNFIVTSLMLILPYFYRDKVKVNFYLNSSKGKVEENLP